MCVTPHAEKGAPKVASGEAVHETWLVKVHTVLETENTHTHARTHAHTHSTIDNFI